MWTTLPSFDMRVHPADILIAGTGAPFLEGSARSHLSDGRVVTWTAPARDSLRMAVDAEIRGRPVPAALARRFGVADPQEFWPLWTHNEVAAKLFGVPIVLWLKNCGLHKRIVAMQSATLYIDDVVLTCGAISAGVARGHGSAGETADQSSGLVEVAGRNGRRHQPAAETDHRA